MSLRGRSAAVAILKFEVWHPAPKHGSTKQKEIPITKNMDSRLHSASLLFIYGSVSFRATIVRSGMANRSVKDCRVGRTRPPRNDTKLVGFCENPTSFLHLECMNRSLSDTATAPPRKRHVTRAQTRISRAKRLSLGQRRNFTAQPCRVSPPTARRPAWRR